MKKGQRPNIVLVAESSPLFSSNEIAIFIYVSLFLVYMQPGGFFYESAW